MSTDDITAKGDPIEICVTRDWTGWMLSARPKPGLEPESRRFQSADEVVKEIFRMPLARVVFEIDFQDPADAHGRNGTFNARRAEVIVRGGRDGPRGPQLMLDIFSRRPGKQPPIWMELSSADAEALGFALLTAVQHAKRREEARCHSTPPA